MQSMGSCKMLLTLSRSYEKEVPDPKWNGQCPEGKEKALGSVSRRQSENKTELTIWNV